MNDSVGVKRFTITTEESIEILNTSIIGLSNNEDYNNMVSLYFNIIIQLKE